MAEICSALTTVGLDSTILLYISQRVSVCSNDMEGAHRQTGKDKKTQAHTNVNMYILCDFLNF